MLRAVLSAATLLFAASIAQAAPRPVAFAEQPAANGVLVLPLAGAGDLERRAAGLDSAARAAVARALTAARFEYKTGAVLPVWGAAPYEQILVVGLGGDSGRQAADWQTVGGAAAQAASKIAGPVSMIAPDAADAEIAMQLGLGAALGTYSFDTYKSPRPDATARSDAPFTVVTPQAGAARQAWSGRGEALAAAMTFTRDLITEPANALPPEAFVERTRGAFRGVRGVTVEALDVAAMEKLGMGGILGVGQGARRPPRLLLVEYRGPGASGAPLVFAGKGITFDSGGISIKPAAGMERMKTDMSGAAAAVGGVLALARQQAPVHVVAVAALAENMPGGNAIRPGDVLRAHNGKTMEIINTDAEGRVVLADAVAYAERRYRPAAIVDLATLTGAIRTAVGDEYAGLFSRHDALARQLETAGRVVGEPLWRLPLHPSYAEDLRSDIADIKNVSEGGAAGAGIGAHFIGFFVEQTPWAHLDIAAVAWTTQNRPIAPAGAAGYGVRLIERFALDFRSVPAGGTLAQGY